MFAFGARPQSLNKYMSAQALQKKSSLFLPSGAAVPYFCVFFLEQMCSESSVRFVYSSSAWQRWVSPGTPPVQNIHSPTITDGREWFRYLTVPQRVLTCIAFPEIGYLSNEIKEVLRKGRAFLSHALFGGSRFFEQKETKHFSSAVAKA